MNENLKNKLIQKLKSPGYQDHKMVLTRRELIKLGLIAGGGALVSLSPVARALEERNAGIPFLVFDLSGGAAMPGNFLVGMKGGPEDLFKSYAPHGWNPRASGALDKRFGLPMSAKSSKMLEGMLGTMPKSISGNASQNYFKMSSFAHFSLDDSSTNRSSAITMVAKSGSFGSLIQSSLGTQPTGSGGNSDVYLRDARYRPKAVASVEDILKLTSFGQDYAALDDKTRTAIFNNLRKAAGNNTQLRSAYDSISQLGVEQPQMDVRTQTEFSALYGGNLDVEAGIVYNVLKGFSGPGVITIGNCDYHDGTGTTGDGIDLRIGQSIGRAVAAANLLKKPLMIQIVTDGGVYAPNSSNFERRWMGDANQHSLTVLGYFDPNGNVKQRKIQVGAYTGGGTVERATLIGDGPEKMALGVILNYLTVNGMSDKFESVASARLQNNEIDELLVFG